MRSDHGHLTAYQIGCEIGQSVVLVMRPTILDRHILALDVAGLTKAFAECGQKACTIGRRAADERDELAAFHRPLPPVLERRIAHLDTAALRDFDPGQWPVGVKSGCPMNVLGESASPQRTDNRSPRLPSASANSLIGNSRRGRVSPDWSCRYFSFFPPSVMFSKNSVIVRFMNSTSAALAGEAAKWPCNDGITT